jgi:hypothetical protein
MNFETYLTQTIQDAVKEAVSKEFDELRKTLMHLENLQNRSSQTLYVKERNNTTKRVG